MPTQHKVKLGDCMSSLTKRYGFGHHSAIFDDGANAALKAKRPNPNVLAENDDVTIPDRKVKEETVNTAASHKFTVKTPKALLRLVLEDDAGAAVAGKKYRLTIDGKAKFEGVTPGDGKVEHPVDADAKAADLELWLVEGEGIDGYLLRFDLGALEHESQVRACQARLLNLGFDTGGVGGALDDRTKDAVRGFQKKHGVTENGALDAATQAKLRQIHEGA